MKEAEKVRAAIAEKFGCSPLACIMTFGCARNVNDSEKIRGILSSVGYKFTDNPRNSDLVIFNTCAVRESAEKKIFGNIGEMKRLKAQKPDMIVAVCGCMVMQPRVVEKIKRSYPFVDLVFGTAALGQIPRLIYDYYSFEKKRFMPSLPSDDVNRQFPIRRLDKVSASISIMYGCDNFCSYCIVPYVRGREKSRRPEDILFEFENLVKRGYKDITLLGQNVNSYGKNLEKNIDFADLLQILCRTEGEYTVRFMSSHPEDISKRLIDTIRDNPHISRHIHLPLQSGNDRILGLMNRRYTVSRYRDIVNYATGKIKNVSFSSDIIVGFPGETFREYMDTENFIKEIGFTQLFTYIYSKRSGTKAALMDDPVSRKEKSRWLGRLISAQKEITFQKLDSFVGTRQRALVTEKRENGNYTARLDNNFVVKFESEEDLLGKFINLYITGKKGTSLTARAEN